MATEACPDPLTVQTMHYMLKMKVLFDCCRSMLEGLAVNPNVTSVQLNIASNDLSGPGSQQMLGVVGRVSCLQTLDISDCSLDSNMEDIVKAVTDNKKILHLSVGRNFNGKAA